MSELPPDQCALPCHGNVGLPRGLEPVVVRGVEPSGTRHSLTESADVQHEDLDTRTRTRRPKGKPTDCHLDAVTGDWVTREHVRDCRTLDCEGCKPCGGDHCELFGSCPNHVNHAVKEFTCPAHIGEVRGIIAEIETLTALVHLELEHSSVLSEVANLAGPVADPDQLDARRSFIVTRDEYRGWCDFPRLALFDIDDELHPVAVFSRWERNLRREYEQPEASTGESERWPLPHKEERDLLARSASYFRRMLDGRFAHDEPFEQFARDVRRVRNHLEEVLSDSRRPDTGVPCPKCAAKLEPGKKAPRLAKRHDDSTTTMRDRDGNEIPDNTRDTWRCPDYPTEHWWKEADYRLRVAGEYLAHADRLTADQIHGQYDIPAGTVRRWASTTRKLVAGDWVEQPPLLRPAGRTPNGVRLYDVAEVLKLRDRTRETSTA